MAKLNFCVFEYRFRRGLETFRTGFNSAIQALQHDVEGAKKELADYQGALDQGGEWIGEYDEDGNVLWDQETLLEMRVEAGEDAWVDLRKTFVIAIYHHWERSIRASTGSTEHGHYNLVRAAEKRGFTIDSRLSKIRDLVNTIKHESAEWGNKLRNSWSDDSAQTFIPARRSSNGARPFA